MLSQNTRILLSYTEYVWLNSTLSGNRMGDSGATATYFLKWFIAEEGEIPRDV